jgi:heat shock protein HslJ
MRVRHRFIVISMLALASLLLAACTVTREPVGEPDDDAGEALVGTEWILDGMNGEPALTETRVTMQFDNGRVGGFSGCNSYGGEYRVEGNRLVLSDIGATAMACLDPENVMDQEAEFHRILASDDLTFEAADDRLRIYSGDADPALEFSAREAFDASPDDLAGTGWQLTAFDDRAAPLDASRIAIRFNGSDFHGNAGCRAFEGSYSATADSAHVSSLSMTSIMCARPEAYSVQEHRFLDVISSAANFNIQDGRLEIHGQTGGVTVFERLPDDAIPEPEDAVWTLDRFIENGESTQVIEGSETTMIFQGGVIREEGSVGGTAGCNQYGAEYSGVNGFEITSWMATEMGCLDPDGIMEQEQRFLAILGSVTSLTIEGDGMELSTDDGVRLVFVPAE